MKLEIGGGSAPKNGFINLDPVFGISEFKRKLQDGIPVNDNTIEEIYTAHTLEHIPTQDRIWCMNECNRVLKIGGFFEIIVPIIGYTDVNGKGHFVNSCSAWADPTHLSYFWMPDSFTYFCRNVAQADYGIKFWKMISAEINDNYEGRVILQKV